MNFDRSMFPKIDWGFVDFVMSHIEVAFRDPQIHHYLIYVENKGQNEDLWYLWRGIMMVVSNDPSRYSDNVRKAQEDMTVNIGRKYYATGTDFMNTGFCNKSWYTDRSYAYDGPMFVSFSDLYDQYHGIHEIPEESFADLFDD